MFTTICRNDTNATWRNSSRKHPTSFRISIPNISVFCRQVHPNAGSSNPSLNKLLGNRLKAQQIEPERKNMDAGEI
jgi:hypothetical protein